MTDIRFTLLTGRAHIKHTDGGDFREATFRALRQGLEQAENVLLEPYYRFKLKAPSDFIGRMMTDIQQAAGTFDVPILTEHDAILTGRAPVATFMNYSTTFAAYTNGKGVLSLNLMVMMYVTIQKISLHKLATIKTPIPNIHPLVFLRKRQRLLRSMA